METKSHTELEWFEFETRMRKVVIDLMQPTVAKLNEDRENVAGLRALAESQKNRVDELENIVLKKGSRSTHFDDIYKKFEEIVFSLIK